MDLFPIDHVLVASDLSDDGQLFNDARALAQRIGATRITLLHALDVSIGLPAVDFATPTPLDAIFDAADASVRKALKQRATSHFGDVEGIEVETVVLRAASPGFAVVDWAQDHGVDLVLVGSHARTGLRRALLGSVAERIVRHAGVPVMVLPNPTS